MSPVKYNLGFTGGAFLYRDSVLLAKLYLETRDWNEVKRKVLADNLLQIRTLNAQKRIYSETYTRLKLLSDEALEIIAQGERDNQLQMIWYAICKKYALIKDFCILVLTPKLSNNERHLVKSDFFIFFNNLAVTHSELEKATPSTIARLAKNLFQMLSTLGLLDKNGNLNPLLVSEKVKNIVNSDPEMSLVIYPGVS